MIFVDGQFALTRRPFDFSSETYVYCPTPPPPDWLPPIGSYIDCIDLAQWVTRTIFVAHRPNGYKTKHWTRIVCSSLSQRRRRRLTTPQNDNVCGAQRLAKPRLGPGRPRPAPDRVNGFYRENENDRPDYTRIKSTLKSRSRRRRRRPPGNTARNQ